MKKPVSFKIAATLYLIGMCFGLVRDILYKFYFELKPDFYYWNPVVFTILVIVVFIGFFLIKKGLNWVRYVSVALYLLGIVQLIISPSYLSQELNFATLLGALILFSYLFRGISIYFLFSKESNLYLKGKSI
jgi:hypothetical protein|tara:strand:+ start:31322 stop:31717 length:396 start_codon:yes stop_codon:yes gene_type:complete